MSDSPASRPKRNSSIAAFYIDEDDFEVEPSNSSGKSKTSAHEDVFIISEKYEESDSDVPEPVKEIFDTKSKAKGKSKTGFKNNVPEKPQAAPAKAKPALKSNAKTKPNNFEEDSFELIVEQNDDEAAETAMNKPARKFVEDEENEEENINLAPIKSKKTVVKKPSSASATVIQRPHVVNNRPKMPSTIEKVRIPGQIGGPRRVGLSKSAPTRPLSPVKLKKFE